MTKEEEFYRWIIADAALFNEKCNENCGVIWFYNLDGSTEASWFIQYEHEKYCVHPIKFNSGCDWECDSILDLINELCKLAHLNAAYNAWFLWDE